MFSKGCFEDSASESHVRTLTDIIKSELHSTCFLSVTVILFEGILFTFSSCDFVLIRYEEGQDG